MAEKGNSIALSEDTKAIITVLLLVTCFPVGIIVMWIWTRWPIWLKVLITVIPLMFFFFVLVLISIPFVFLKWAGVLPSYSNKMYQQGWNAEKTLNTQSTNGNWNSYTDPTHKFSLEHPGVVLSPTNKGDIPYILSVLLPIQEKQKTGDCFSVEVWQNPQNLSLENFLKQYVGPGTSIDKSVMVGGTEGKQTKDMVSIEGAVDVFVKKGTAIYQLSFFPGSPEYDQSTFQKILSTFKFI